MTLIVKISHALPGYPSRVLAQVVDPVTGSVYSGQHLADGESCELAVHSGAAIRLTEAAPAPQELAPTAAPPAVDPP